MNIIELKKLINEQIAWQDSLRIFCSGTTGIDAVEDKTKVISTQINQSNLLFKLKSCLERCNMDKINNMLGQYYAENIKQCDFLNTVKFLGGIIRFETEPFRLKEIPKLDAAEIALSEARKRKAGGHAQPPMKKSRLAEGVFGESQLSTEEAIEQTGFKLSQAQSMLEKCQRENEDTTYIMARIKMYTKRLEELEKQQQLPLENRAVSIDEAALLLDIFTREEQRFDPDQFDEEKFSSMGSP